MPFARRPKLFAGAFAALQGVLGVLMLASAKGQDGEQKRAGQHDKGQAFDQLRALQLLNGQLECDQLAVTEKPPKSGYRM